MAKVQGYYYLHKNGDLIYKPYDEGRVADFRESPFVQAFWPLDTSSRENAWTILIEALAAGVIGIKLKRDGVMWCATPPGFVDLMVSKAGFGDTCLEALGALAKELGYSPTKMWGPTFKSLLKKEQA